MSASQSSSTLLQTSVAEGLIAGLVSMQSPSQIIESSPSPSTSSAAGAPSQSLSISSQDSVSRGERRALASSQSSSQGEPSPSASVPQHARTRKKPVGRLPKPPSRTPWFAAPWGFWART